MQKKYKYKIENIQLKYCLYLERYLFIVGVFKLNHLELQIVNSSQIPRKTKLITQTKRNNKK